MALPDLGKETSYKKIELLSGLKVGIKPWLVKEKKNFLIQAEKSENEVEFLEAVKNLLASCIDKPKTMEKMSERDFLFALSELRKMSEGETIEFVYRCPHCESRGNEAVIDLNTDVVKTQFAGGKVEIPDHDLVFTTRELSFDEVNTLREKYKDSKAELNYQYLLQAIVAFSHKDKLYQSFTITELDDFLGGMQTTALETLIDKVRTSMSRFYIDKKVNCENPECGKEVQIYFEELYRFFVL